MRILIAMVFAGIALCASCAKKLNESVSVDTGFPSAPFTFVGVPLKIREGSHDNGEGRYRSYQMKVVEVRKGMLPEKEIDYYFPEESAPPLEIGERYLFTAVYDQHGIRYTDFKKIDEPNEQSSQPTPPKSG